MEDLIKLMVQSQQETSRALQALAGAIQQQGQQPRITNSAGRGGRGGGGRGSGRRSNRGGRGNQPRAAPQVVEVRDVASQKEAAERATLKTRIRTALRQMSLAIDFVEDSWWETDMRRWYNAALRSLEALIALDFPAGGQREDFFEQVRQVAYAFNIGSMSDDPKAVLGHLTKMFRDRHGRDSFYPDGHVKIQDSRGQAYGREDLGKVPLPGISNVKLSSHPSETKSAEEGRAVGLGFELLSLLEDGDFEFQTESGSGRDDSRASEKTSKEVSSG